MANRILTKCLLRLASGLKNYNKALKKHFNCYLNYKYLKFNCFMVYRPYSCRAPKYGLDFSAAQSHLHPFDRIIQDQNLNPTHISLYITLFQYWNINHFQNPISITREEVMRISKICSTATYHKCIKELNEKGYIKYEPSFNPFKGSMVILFNFSEDQNQLKKG